MKQHAPAAERNQKPILEVLQSVLPRSGLLLEVASGTGQHAAFCAASLPDWTWQPTDQDGTMFDSIVAWTRDAAGDGVTNIEAPLVLDASQSTWPVSSCDALLCANMIHIAPWSAAEGLITGAARVLRPGSPLVLYGPYVRRGVPTAPSNAAFDASLRSRNAAWGVRSLEDVTALAESVGLYLERVVEMPANNVTVVFRRPFVEGL